MIDGSHVLMTPPVLTAIERAASAHRGRPWTCTGFSDLAARSSHPAGVLRGDPISVFAKVLTGADGPIQARTELSGLALIRELSAATTAAVIGGGRVEVGGLTVLVFEALSERPPEDRTSADWEAIGRTLAAIHDVHGASFGLHESGYFGPLHQDNRPVNTNTWAQFYRDRRVLAWLASAVDAGSVSSAQATQIERMTGRLDDLVGTEPIPTLLHGDAQHHNFVSTPAGAVVIDASPYYGHPEIDLALVDYFTPVPPQLFAAYAEIHPINPGFAARRELWRLFAYLGILTVDRRSPWSQQFYDRLAAAVRRYA